ncbi:MAG: family 1 glycosylhydrolase [Calothrix sp. MO_167.B12]|nr:family 1 glycosylhydrolase [Calothrix sp. MO_167.B12]
MSNWQPLPKSFMFGVNTADHQCEAYEPELEDIRDVWERRRNQTLRGRATDFWNRYPEDIALAKNLGCKTFRLSIAWSRVEPKPNQFDDAAFEHYRQLLQTIRDAGMKSVVTLHHFTWPIHVESRGGMIADSFPGIFAIYATEAARRLGDLVDYWITFNEPSQLIYGYIKPWWEREYFIPPGLPRGATFTNQMEALGKLMHNLFLAHAKARTEIKDIHPQAKVGTNPMLLGLPRWLQWFIDRNVINLRSREEFIAQGKSYVERSLLEQGKVDVVLANLTVNPERQSQLAFSEVYYLAGQTVLVTKNSPIQQLNDLAHKTVAVVKSSTAASRIREIEDLSSTNPLVVADYEEALRVIEYEQAAAVLSDDVILQGTMQKYPGKYRLIGNKLTEEPYAASVAKGNRELLNAVDIAIKRFKKSGEWQKSLNRYFPSLDISEPPGKGRRSTLADLTSDFHVSVTSQPVTEALPLASPKTALRKIQKRGYLIVAVKDDVPGFSYRDPDTGEYSGLEIDLARAIAQQIFNDPTKVVFQPTNTQQRISLVRSLIRFIEPVQQLVSVSSTCLTSNWWYLGMAGKLPEFLCPPECVGQLDFVGLDYYWGISNLRLTSIQKLMNTVVGRFGDAPVWPEIFYYMLKFHSRLFPDQEIMIIENGCVDEADGIDRSTYLRLHIEQIQRAVQDGVNVTGYVCWSLTSNREWGLPFDSNSDFGIYHIELDKDPYLKRVPTTATETYRKIIHNRGV